MISFSIGLSQPCLSCITNEEGWFFEESFIRPFKNPVLEAYALTDETQCLFIVRERNAHNPSDGSKSLAIQKVSTRELELERKELAEWPLHYIAVLINGKRVTINTGAWGVSPIYIVQKNDRLLGHWDASELYKHLPAVEPDKELVAHFLVMYDRPYSKDTLFKGMHCLTERSVLHWDGNAAPEIKYPPALEQPFARELKPGADVAGMFHEILRHSMSRWVNKDIKTAAAALSSGLDSGIVSIIAASLSPCKLHTYGLLVTEEFREAQIGRREEYITRFGYEDTCLLAEDFLPFSKDYSDPHNRKNASWEECYHEAFEQLLNLAQQKKEILLFAGFGGDELLLPYLDEMSEADQHAYAEERYVQRETVPGFITDDLYQAYADTKDTLKRAPRSLMAYSSVEAVAYSSREYLKHGIWPVNPYCTPELIQFCRSLPWEWRKDRRLQREVLANAGCSRNITHPSQPEHFGHLMARAMQRAAPKVNQLFKNSRLADLGYIDPGKFITAYNYHIAQPQASGYSDMDFYTVIAMEYSMLAVDGEVSLKAMV